MRLDVLGHCRASRGGKIETLQQVSIVHKKLIDLVGGARSPGGYPRIPSHEEVILAGVGHKLSCDLINLISQVADLAGDGWGDQHYGDHRNDHE